MNFKRGNRGLSLSLAVSVVAGAALAGAGCSSNNNTSGTGGAGTRDAGDASSSSGGSGSGGSLGAGGLALGTGGTTGIGGDIGTGGDMGTAATGGMGCPTAAVYTHVSTFGSIFDGWTIATNSTSTLVPMPAAGDAAASGTVLALDTMDGSPAMNGSAKLSIPFSDSGEQLLFASNSTGMNITGTIVTAQIKLDSGLNTSPVNTGQAFIVVKSGPFYTYVAGPTVNLDSTAGWVTLTLDADLPTPSPPFGYTPCDIREIDVVIQTGAVGTYGPAVVHIDTIAITQKNASDGGTGQ